MDDHLKCNPEVPDHPSQEAAGSPQPPSPALSRMDSKKSPAHGKNDVFPEFLLLWLAVNLIDHAPRRVRRALESQAEAVMRSIARFGFRIPILVRSTPGGERYEVVDGHTRLAAALRLGAEKLPCILVDDLPDVEIRRLVLSLNKLQETAEWDKAALRLEIGEIIEISGELEIPGFSMPEIEALRFGTGGAEEPDPADDLSGFAMLDTPVVSRAGDIWCLDDHRILCGSARDATVIAALLDGQLADAVFTDPPYNVKINGHVRSQSAGFAEFAEASGGSCQMNWA